MIPPSQVFSCWKWPKGRNRSRIKIFNIIYPSSHDDDLALYRRKKINEIDDWLTLITGVLNYVSPKTMYSLYNFFFVKSNQWHPFISAILAFYEGMILVPSSESLVPSWNFPGNGLLLTFRIVTTLP